MLQDINSLLDKTSWMFFYDKVVCVSLIPSQTNESCRSHWKIAITYMFFTRGCKLFGQDCTFAKLCGKCRKFILVCLHTFGPRS